ncbi:RNA polymerase sigma factor [Tuwongella immobilis]|uniref:Rna polymerase sigma-70 ecf subfamily:: Sigma70_r2 n=1 Tax=Tuwongella immobilis TaxID=692036 RepID=A0A6C2YPH0_9BACT|nr:sigma-70 family RNA polymerase sigma factor [Tuwongella immobilis]VIP02925.1 rna polymerase sigma-70 ecf subfamily : : Sigma70_r2 [Tuwongella immobilis]VTS02863.1 rna polymerase sigma-70 ecf subfamily : : Sigma70_r2 [Tuwongella immobilis]
MTTQAPITTYSRQLFDQITSNYHDNKAWREFMEYYTPYFQGWATRCVGRDDAEDLVSELFLRVWRELSMQRLKAPEGQGIRPWMSRVAGRLMTDYHRKSARVRPQDINFDQQIDTMVMDMMDTLTLSEKCDQYVSAWTAYCDAGRLHLQRIWSYVYTVRKNQPRDWIASRFQIPANLVSQHLTRVRSDLASTLEIDPQQSRDVDDLDRISMEHPKLRCILLGSTPDEPHERTIGTD